MMELRLTNDTVLRVRRRPFAFELRHCGRLVLRTTRRRSLTFMRDGVESGASRLLSFATDRGRHHLCVSTQCPGVELLVDFEVVDSHLECEVRLSDGRSAERLAVGFLTQRGESWFGAEVTAASQWRLNAKRINRSPFVPADNQTAPLWLSSKGVALLKCDHSPVGFSFHERGKDVFELHSLDAPELRFCLCPAADIRRAWQKAISVLGTPRTAPPFEYFRRPSYCTWIEFLTEVTQDGILHYVSAMRESGFRCGVLTIDDKWTRSYGDLEFDAEKFPSPRRMIDELHAQGIAVALWVTPFVDPQSPRYCIGTSQGYLLRRKGKTEPYLARWWNGEAALVDLSNPEARAWFVEGLHRLAHDVGADGFKLDAGDASFLAEGYDSFAPVNPWEYADAFASIGAEFRINELRVSWLTQRLGLVQRLRDKAPTWSRVDGLGSLVPHGLYEGLLGYPYFCADMIGGGWDVYFRNGSRIDEELFVRWTQASSLLPIMQFSYAPWKLEEDNAAICRRYAELHEELSGYIYELACRATRDGTPIVKPLFFDFPADAATYTISDQFLLGDRFLVAPVLEKEARQRPVYLPRGQWRDYWSDRVVPGPRLIKRYTAELDTLPLFERVG
jgi:myogenesis-regulating glycosidase